MSLPALLFRRGICSRRRWIRLPSRSPRNDVSNDFCHIGGPRVINCTRTLSSRALSRESVDHGCRSPTPSTASFVGAFHFTTSTENQHHRTQQFPKDCYPPYKRAVRDILSNKEFKSKKAGQGLWTEGTFHKFERWLLRTTPAVDERATHERWSDSSREWMDQMDGLSAREGSGAKRAKGSDGTTDRSSCMSNFTTQREALRSVIFATPPERDETDARLKSRSFSRMLQFVFDKLVDRCLEGADGSRVPIILPAVWYKMKESGVVLQRSKLRLLLDATSAASYSTLEQQQQQQSTMREDELLEELVVYHDLLSSREVGSEETFYRRYPAMLKHHCESGDASAALSLLRRVRTLRKSPFEHDHYALALATLAEHGRFRHDARLFDEIAEDMAAQAWEIAPSSAIRLRNALVKEFQGLALVTDRKELQRSEEDVPVRDHPAIGNELLACRVEVDPSTWICPVTNARLRCYSFEPAKRKLMEKNILATVRKQSTLAEELEKFADWLRNRPGPPFTVFLDGANMGSSIQPMMANLDANGHNSLAILSEKAVVSGRRSLERRGKIYVVSDRSHDDLFCMIATVTNQTRSLSNHPSPEEPVVLMTNDLFRDHEQELSDPALVRQWRRHHCRRHCSLMGKMRPLPPVPSKRTDWKDVNQWLRNHCDGPAGLGGVIQNNSENPEGIIEQDDNSQDDTRSEADSLTPHQQEQVYQDILALAHKKSTALDELNKFSDWLDNRAGHPFTVILDGANIGSLESMVAKLEAKGEYPLVVYPEKFSTLNPKSMSGSYRLRNSGKLYFVSDWHDDDLYCMIATVSEQKAPCSRHLNPCAPGIRPILITNDQFLDHKKKMKDKALFHEWYDHHCYKHDHSSLKKLPTEVFSKRIERSDFPNNDEGDAPPPGGKVWHFPVSGWGFHERFVIGLPRISSLT